MHTVHLRPELRGLGQRILELPLTLVSAPAGSGKSTLLEAWRDALEAEGTATAWIDLAALHADPGSFLEDLAGEIDRARDLEPGSDGFGATLLRRLPHLGDPDPHLLARLFADELRDLGEPVAIFLDNYHRLAAECPVDLLLSQALRDGASQLHLVVATRGAAPAAATRMLTEGRALEVGRDDLSLRADQLEQILRDRGVEIEEDAVPRLLAQTAGWATGVLLAARVIAEGRAADSARFVAELSNHEDLFSYVASELLSGESDEMLTLLENAALLGSARREVLESLSSERAAERVDEALGKGLLLRVGPRIGLHHLWEAMLRERLRRRLDAALLRDGVERAVSALEASGEAPRAVELCIELDQPDLGVRLIETYGLDWIERGMHDNVSRWLAAVARPDSDSPDLALVRALLDGRRDAGRAIDALEMAADRFREKGALDRELAARHNALILAANENLDDRARRAVMRIVRPRRLISSSEARAIAVLFMGLGAGLTGRHRLARRLLERSARHDFSPRERGAVMLGRTQLAIVSGEWEHAAQLTEEGLSDPAQRSHGPAYFTLRGMRALARGVLGREVDVCLEQIEEARDAFADFGLAVSEAEMSAFMGRLLAKEGRPEEAREALDRALHLYSQLGASEGQANVHSMLARIQRDLGNGAAAHHHAAATLEICDGARLLRRRPWTGALAARVLAEEGDVAGARAFVARHSRSLDAPDLPMSQHAIHVALARVAELAGDSDATRRHLELAHRAAAGADLRVVSPEIDGELLHWAAQAALEHDLDTEVADRFDPASEARVADVEPPLRIVSLGTFRVERDGEPIEARAWRGATPQRLLQRLLIANGRPLSREQIGVDFWPDANPSKARGSLRVTLNKLRQALEPGRAAGDPERWLRVDGEHLAVADEALAGWDVVSWKGLLDAAGRADEDTALELRGRAIRDYGGPFLPDCFDDWAQDLRGELEARFAREGGLAVEALLARGRADEAAELAACLLAQDVTSQTAWSLRVRAELDGAVPEAARRELDRAAEALRHELGAEPGEALQELSRAITPR